MRHATPADDIITQMAQLLVRLVELTPPGMANLRATNPEHALLLLQEGDNAMSDRTTIAQGYRDAGIPPSNPFDNAREIDLQAAINGEDETED